MMVAREQYFITRLEIDLKGTKVAE